MKRPRERLLEGLRSEGFTPFQLKVYRRVCAIPWGETRSYKWVADGVRRGSSRAVGQALKKNPYPFIIPCHRVIRSDDAAGGFSQGARLKKRLLGLEKVAIIDATKGR